MSRYKSATRTKREVRTSPAENTPAASVEISPFRRVLASAALFFVVLAAGAYLWADWYFGLPDDAVATFVGRQSCAQCHQQQHDAWQGSHHDLAMDRADENSVLGDFNDATLTHHGLTSRMFRKGGKFFVNTEGPDGKL